MKTDSVSLPRVRTGLVISAIRNEAYQRVQLKGATYRASQEIQRKKNKGWEARRILDTGRSFAIKIRGGGVI